ncbi:MAG TPA: NAD+ synthase, partial [Saprospiraceae bacterium]|nr:NAD+ synthase [Saprospiraceae bacterium]
TYDIFDEYRYFEPAHEFSTVEYKGKRIAFTICEDIWNVGNDNPLYKVCPMDEMMKDKPDIMINLSASPFSYDHAESRISAVRANVSKYGVPMFYVNHVGAQTEIIFDGGSLVVSPDLQVFDEMPYFEECIKTYNLADVQKGGINNEQQKEKYRLMHDAIVTGIRDYFGKLGLKKAILGLSGGIDSALTAVLAVRALGAENVWGVLMPSEYSTGHSVTDAKDLAVNLGIRHDIVPIRSVFDVYEGLLNPLFEGKQADVTEENIQARIRGMILMALSNKFGHILLNTSNKSEFAVGYGTLYGDMCGGLAVLGDVYKTEIYKLAAYVNKDGEVIPLNSICKPPSAELRPGQKDSDSLPEYDTLPPVLFQYIENRIGPAELMEMGFDPAMVNRILRLVNINEFKRFQAPPVIRVSNKAFGAGRRLPIVGKYLS